MAIGMALMFGFEFPENFNLPYIARSIKEFWRRWHISLSTWFKDYLYIPLGGNRLGTSRMYVNLIIVFFITGFWHGASWTFVVWGLFHGSFLIIERIGLGNILDKSPKIISNFYTLIVVMMGWVLFRADDFSLAGSFYKALFNFSLPLNELSFFRLTFTRDFWFALTIGVPGALGVFTLIQQKVNNVSPKINKIIRYSFEVGYVIVLAGLLFLCSIYLIAGTYNPFIYFRF
jgi:alginate O-acetyltransferase complex protein AlgI